MNKKRILGIFLIVVGVVLILNSQTQILGAVVGLKEISSSVGLIVGLVFVCVGIIILMNNQQKDLSNIVNTPTKSQEKALREMEQAINSGKKLTPKEAERMYKAAGYSSKSDKAKGDHVQVAYGNDPVRNPPTDSRPGAIVELDRGSRSRNPDHVIKKIVYDFKERRFKDYYSPDAA
ncbi:MAG: DUF308 domain-containing protein [Nanoarchaeota archaeon]|mgnify:CR=1 FL=1